MNNPRRALLALLTDLQQAGVEALPRSGGLSATSGVSPAPSHPIRDVTEGTVDSIVRPLSHESGAAHLRSSLPGALFSMADAQSRTAAPQSLAEEKSAAPSLEILAEEVAACTRCAELASSRTQTVFADGNPTARLVFLGEAPGADEDRQGKPFVGRAGKLLTDIIGKGMKLGRSDVYIMNVLKCRPPGNRTPLPHEAHNCRPFLLRQLELVSPEFVCCLGAVAAQNLLQTTQSIGKMRGRFFDLGGIRVMCTYHPAYLLRNPSAKKQTWEDIQMLMQAMGLA
jgi:uracil-DNA glycosylase